MATTRPKNLKSKLTRFTKDHTITPPLGFGLSYPRVKDYLRARKKKKKVSKKNGGSLPVYLSLLGLVGKSQALGSSLTVIPRISGSFQSHLILGPRAWKNGLKVTTSTGLGLVSTSPKCYIRRSTKTTSLEIFFKSPGETSSGRIGRLKKKKSLLRGKGRSKIVVKKKKFSRVATAPKIMAYVSSYIQAQDRDKPKESYGSVRFR